MNVQMQAIEKTETNLLLLLIFHPKQKSGQQKTEETCSFIPYQSKDINVSSKKYKLFTAAGIYK